jgi:hypothetical protein
MPTSSLTLAVHFLSIQQLPGIVQSLEAELVFPDISEVYSTTEAKGAQSVGAGNYHMLTNINTCHTRCPQGVECGGHAWSHDGLTFSDLHVGAFGPYPPFPQPISAITRTRLTAWIDWD